LGDEINGAVKKARSGIVDGDACRAFPGGTLLYTQFTRIYEKGIQTWKSLGRWDLASASSLKSFVWLLIAESKRNSGGR